MNWLKIAFFWLWETSNHLIDLNLWNISDSTLILTRIPSEIDDFKSYFRYFGHYVWHFRGPPSLTHSWGHRIVPTRATVPQISYYDRVLTACEIDFNTWTECGSAVIGRFLLIFYFENIWYFIIVIIRIIFIDNIVFIIVSKSAIEAVCTPWYYRILLPMTSVALKINILPMIQNL